MDKGVPVISLAATNLDGLMAIILWTVFMTIELGGGDVLGVVFSAVLQITLGVAWGLLIGYLARRLFDRYLADRPFWLRATSSWPCLYWSFSLERYCPSTRQSPCWSSASTL